MNNILSKKEYSQYILERLEKGNAHEKYIEWYKEELKIYS